MIKKLSQLFSPKPTPLKQSAEETMKQHRALIISITLLRDTIYLAEEARVLDLPLGFDDPKADDIAFDQWERVIPEETAKKAKLLHEYAKDILLKLDSLDTNDREILEDEFAWIYYITRAAHHNHGFALELDNPNALLPHTDDHLVIDQENLELFYDLAILEESLYEALIKYTGLDPVRFNPEVMLNIFVTAHPDQIGAINNPDDFWQWMNQRYVELSDQPPTKPEAEPSS